MKWFKNEQELKSAGSKLIFIYLLLLLFEILCNLPFWNETHMGQSQLPFFFILLSFDSCLLMPHSGPRAVTYFDIQVLGKIPLLFSNRPWRSFTSENLWKVLQMEKRQLIAPQGLSQLVINQTISPDLKQEAKWEAPCWKMSWFGEKNKEIHQRKPSNTALEGNLIFHSSLKTQLSAKTKTCVNGIFHLFYTQKKLENNEKSCVGRQTF